MGDLPQYTLKESQRAKHVRLKITAESGLVITIPAGFPKRKIPHILREKQAWIERHLNQLAQRLAEDFPPQQLHLQAIQQEWQIHYAPAMSDARVVLKPHDAQCLSISGDHNDPEALKQVLRRWLQHMGKTHLRPWLFELSESTHLPIQKITIRGQKTRWGSCSSRGNINLNYKLLFLPPAQARYVMLHELAHTQHMNHSPAYWQFLQTLEPQALILDKAMNQAWKHVPVWI